MGKIACQKNRKDFLDENLNAPDTSFREVNELIAETFEELYKMRLRMLKYHLKFQPFAR